MLVCPRNGLSDRTPLGVRTRAAGHLCPDSPKGAQGAAGTRQLTNMSFNSHQDAVRHLTIACLTNRRAEGLERKESPSRVTHLECQPTGALGRFLLFPLPKAGACRLL